MARTFSDMVLDVEDKIKSIYGKPEYKEIVEQINSIVAELNGDGPSGLGFNDHSVGNLSRLGGKLAILQFNLIPIRDLAYRQSKIAKAHTNIKINSVRATVKSKLNLDAKASGLKPPTMDDVSAAVDASIAETKLLEDLHGAEYEKLQSLWYSIPNILHRVEIRIKVLMSDGQKIPTHFYNDADVLEVPNISEPGINYDEAMLIS